MGVKKSFKSLRQKWISGTMLNRCLSSLYFIRRRMSQVTDRSQPCTLSRQYLVSIYPHLNVELANIFKLSGCSITTQLRLFCIYVVVMTHKTTAMISKSSRYAQIPQLLETTDRILDESFLLSRYAYGPCIVQHARCKCILSSCTYAFPLYGCLLLQTCV